MSKRGAKQLEESLFYCEICTTGGWSTCGWKKGHETQWNSNCWLIIAELWDGIQGGSARLYRGCAKAVQGCAMGLVSMDIG